MARSVCLLLSSDTTDSQRSDLVATSVFVRIGDATDAADGLLYQKVVGMGLLWSIEVLNKS